MNKRTAILGATVAAVAITLAVGFTYYQTANAQTASAPIATPAPSEEPSYAPSMSPAPDKKAILGEVMTTASTYLGVSASDLKTQLQSGKTLADIANATPGKSRDGLLSALSNVIDPKMAAKLIDRAITPK